MRVGKPYGMANRKRAAHIVKGAALQRIRNEM